MGMERQAKYDQGVQKIQGQIDNVAGMDIIKDVDKANLQSKLNQLGSDLRAVAASDFSNFQLVNSVGGMATQIIKDPTIQNAVSSTAWYRKQAAEMEKATQAGKSSQANIDDFNEKAGKWMNSQNVGEKFSDRYTQYIDVKKKAMDAIKALHSKLQGYDIPFEVKDGQINQSKIADAMKRYKIEGIDEGQIAAAINASLSPDDINQLSIDAKYQFKGITPDKLVNIATENYKNSRESALAAVKFLTEKKQTTVDPTETDKIDRDLAFYESQLGKDGTPGLLDSQLRDNLKNISENPDQVKTSLYTDGFVKQFANAFSWKNQEAYYVDSPLKKEQNWVAEMKLRQETENRQRYEFGVETRLKEQANAIAAEKVALDRAAIYGVDSPWTTLGNKTDDELLASSRFVDNVSSVEGTIDGNNQKLLNAGYSQEKINMMLNKKLDIPARAAGTIQEMLRDQNYLKSLQAQDYKLRAEADKEANVTEIKKSVLVNKPSLNITWQGKNLQLSPEEVLGIEAATKTTTQTSKGGNRRTTTVDIRGFNKRQLDFVNSMNGVIYGKFEPGPQPAGYDAIRGQVNAITGQYGKALSVLSDAMAKSNQIYNQKLAPLVSDFVPQIKVLGSDKDGSPTAATLGQVSALVTATIARGVKADGVYDPSTASAMLSSEKAKDTRVFIQQSGSNFEVILKSESDPSKLQRIKITQQEALDKFGPKYVNDKVQESTRLKLGRGNTNLTGSPDDAIMQKSFGDFPGVTKMNITADLDQDLSNPNLYVPVVNIMKKDGRYQSFALSGVNNLSRVGYDQGKANLNSLTNNVLLTYLKQEYPNYDYSQLDIK